MREEESNTIEFYRRIMDAMPCMMFVKDASRRFLDGNRPFVEYMGVSSLAEIVGLTDYNFYDPDVAAQFAEGEKKVFEDPEGKPLECLQTSRAPDGRVRYLRMKKMQAKDASGRTCLLGVAVDETDVHEALERARKAEMAKSHFFSAVSHDIRTPLTSIVGFCELLKLGIKKEEDRQKALSTIVSSSQMLQKLIGDVLDLAKLESGTMEILPATTDCAKLARDAIAPYEAACKRKGVKLVASVSVDSLLEIDAQRVRQILVYLLGNAVKFTAKGQVDVSVTYYAEPELLSISVSDTGCGISSADQQRIADPYADAGRRGRNGGTGFGLAIVKQLVYRMNGEMTMRSAPGAGSSFMVTLSGVKASSAQRRREYSRTQRIKFIVGSRKDRGAQRILVVDDSLVNLIALRSMLGRLGYTKIVTASNGREALEKLAADPQISLVLTDVWMPEVNGLQLAREIKTNPRYKHVKVYAVTADTGIRNDYAETGFLDVLLKPVTLDVLGKVL